MKQKLLIISVVATCLAIVPSRAFGQAEAPASHRSAIQTLLDSLPNAAFTEAMVNRDVSRPNVRGKTEGDLRNAEVLDLANAAAISRKKKTPNKWRQELRKQRKQFEDISNLLGVGSAQSRDADLVKDMIVEFLTATTLEAKRERPNSEEERLEQNWNHKMTERLAAAERTETLAFKLEKDLSEKFGVSRTELKEMKNEADDWYSEFKRNHKRALK